MKRFYLLHAVKVRYDANIRCVFVCVSIATGLKWFIMRPFCKYEPLRIGGDESLFFFFFFTADGILSFYKFMSINNHFSWMPFHHHCGELQFQKLSKCCFFRSNIYIYFFLPLCSSFSASFPLSQITAWGLSLLIEKKQHFLKITKFSPLFFLFFFSNFSCWLSSVCLQRLLEWNYTKKKRKEKK